MAIGAGAALLGSAAISGAAGLAGGAIQAGADAAAAKKSRKFTREENAKARYFTAKQSNTVAQRSVIDLRLAGLNPILAAGGAGVGNAGSASGASAPLAKSDKLRAGLEAARLAQEIQNMMSMNKKTKADERGQTQINDIRQPVQDAANVINTITGAAKGGKSQQQTIMDFINNRPATKGNNNRPGASGGWEPSNNPLPKGRGLNRNRSTKTTKKQTGGATGSY